MGKRTRAEKDKVTDGRAAKRPAARWPSQNSPIRVKASEDADDKDSESIVRKVTGDIPSGIELDLSVADDVEDQCYFYGGYNAEKKPKATDVFYRLDVPTLRWSNLTDEVIKIGSAYNRFSSRTKQRLPALEGAAMTLIVWGGKQYLALFGGKCDGQVSSDFIFIDICASPPEWFTVPVAAPEGTPVKPRMFAFLLVAQRRLFVFGGTYGDEFTCHRSYSVASYDDAAEKWAWSVVDREHPDHIPNLGSAMDGAVVCGGEKLLLTAGREEDDRKTDFTPKSFVLLNTENNDFAVRTEPAGEYPRKVQFYKIHNVSPGFNRSEAAQASQSSDNPTQDTHPNNDAESVVICSWKGINSPPKLWKYDIKDGGTSRRLELAQPLPRMPTGYGLNDFLRVGERFLLLGIHRRRHIYDRCVFISLRDGEQVHIERGDRGSK